MQTSNNQVALLTVKKKFERINSYLERRDIKSESPLFLSFPGKKDSDSATYCNADSLPSICLISNGDLAIREPNFLASTVRALLTELTVCANYATEGTKLKYCAQSTTS